MKAYRLYLLNSDDRITDAVEGVFASDAEALAKAQASCKDHHAIEVWSGARLVGRLGEEFQLRRRY
ncbi:MAG: hypothetical protein ACK4YQ_07055 [Phenylobacterium sp.]|uniref:hypothetical protein n=1 Tax=Phenylobacterium sp. TaxID=1871053 RepID=UPI00391B0ACB